MEHKQITGVREWEEVALPIAMILTGLILIGGAMMGFVSLERIQNCWPIALISIGVMELFAPARNAKQGR